MTPEERAKDLQNRRLVPRMLLSETGSFDPMQQVADTIRAAVAEEREACARECDRRAASAVDDDDPRIRVAGAASLETAAAIRARGEPQPQIVGEKLEELYDRLAPALIEQGVIKPVTAAEVLEAARKLRQQAMCELAEYEDKKPADPQPDAIAEPPTLHPCERHPRWSEVPPEDQIVLRRTVDETLSFGRQVSAQLGPVTPAVEDAVVRNLVSPWLDYHQPKLGREPSHDV